MTVKYLISCSKCPYTQEHEWDSLEQIKEFRDDWNKFYKGRMTCEHNYQYKLLSKNTKSNIGKGDKKCH